MTADVIEALMEEARLEDPVILEREQAEIAARSGQIAKHLTCGRLVAEIHPDVYAAWEHQRGKEFFSKKAGGDGIDYLLKHFPACRVKSEAANPMLLVNGFRDAPLSTPPKPSPAPGVRGRRGRWALQAA